MSGKKLFYLILVSTTSFASMALEIITARMVSGFTHNYVAAQCLTISVFILGLGCGSYLFNFIKRKSILNLLKIEIGLYFVFFFSFFSIEFFHIYVTRSDIAFSEKTLLLLCFPQIFVFVAATLVGTEIPFFQNEWLIRSAFSYFDDFALEEPKSLRGEILKRCKSALELYAGK